MAENILVIILAITLAVLLLLCVIAISITIKILNHLRTIVEKAEHIADNAGTVSDFFSRASGPMAVARLFASVADNVLNKSSKKGKK